MVNVTLYAKAHSCLPFLSGRDLESEIFNPHPTFFDRTGMALTDVGEIIWEIAKSMDANASIGCRPTKGYTKGWEKWVNRVNINIIIRTSALTILLAPKAVMRKDYPVFHPVLKIQFEGDIENIQFVVKKLVDTLDYLPYEFKEYWDQFQRTYNISRLEVVEKWKALLETTQPKGETDAIYCTQPKGETDAIYCTQCGKTLRADAKFCDQCGGKVE